VSGRPLPAIEITDTGSFFIILVPLNGLDAYRFYVFALPHSILIEIRLSRSIVHYATNCEEIQHQRVTRELKLGHAIKEGSTTVRLSGSDLEINCVKAPRSDDRAWSELVQMDTRCSLGCV
jgi:hypothetical protein